MIKRLLSFEWKQFSRSSYFKKGIAIKILLAFAVLYFGGMALLLGGSLFFILKKTIPETDPMTTVNSFLFFWFIFDFMLRYFMQQLPVMNVKPLMIIPVKRNTVIYYLLGKTSVSFFNILPLFIVVPFTIVLLVQGYPVIPVLAWLIGFVAITGSINFINFLVNKNNVVFYVVLALVATFGVLEYYSIFKISEPMGYAFNYMYAHPYLVVVPIVALVALFNATFHFIKKGFYLDDAISKKVKEVSTTDLSWLNRFGAVAPFLKNDIKLIQRNVRPRQVMMMSFMFLFYGLVFYTQDTYREMPALLAFASMFITGGFLMTFGQYVPSWDSEYYKLLMSQNIPYKTYLESKWYLMVVAVLFSFILSTPYIYFGWDIFGMIAAGAVFNIGLNSFLTLFGGALNRVPIELNVKAKAFSNTNGFNPTQLLIGLPKFLLPMLIFYVPYKLINFNAGLIALALVGVLGIVFRPYIFNKIEQVYQKGKYKTIAAFSEKQ
ncbi:hypothetical protein ES677_04885 [Bizionia gelidisalsuginis]|uniref:Uncharacterized protein n=2 Tax=Bizionia TaxID=283785 RepID=A0A8H2QEH7_9FLAO|nr:MULTISPECIES: DUF5687 family protein [Bizionia]TYB74218.1 hypothetical protein ES676_08535 [Bizionia saleffrena]TYC15680.1 hypothetical protein ES677_04885 [Bizionia gelidisalsuginis]